MILTLPMECSNTKDDIHEFLGQGSTPSIGYSLHYHTSHKLEVLDFHFLVQE